MQRIENYGSFLQAYSLKTILESMGHSVTFIDIKDEHGNLGFWPQYTENEIKYQIKMFYRKIKYPSWYSASFKRNHLFHKKLFPMLGVEKIPNDYSNEKFDICFIGSDEVFNCCQDSPWGKTMHLFGESINTKKIATYAASFGSTTMQDLEEHQLVPKIEKLVNQYSAISVRDENSLSILSRITDKPIFRHLDPVFLSDYSGLIPRKIEDKNYILVYGYDGRICEDEFINSVKKFAHERNLKTIALGMAQKWCDKTVVVNPFELLAYFKNADYIVTDTFHGSVFSIKYQKQFVTIIRDSNRQKLTALLDTFGLKERAAGSGESIKRILLEAYNKAYVSNIICSEKERSMDYLEKCLGDN